MAKRRFQVGDVVVIRHSRDKSLRFQMAVIESWLPQCGRWGVRLVSGTAQGRSLETGEMIVSPRCAFLDTSLFLLCAAEPDPACDVIEHGEVPHG